MKNKRGEAAIYYAGLAGNEDASILLLRRARLQGDACYAEQRHQLLQGLEARLFALQTHKYLQEGQFSQAMCQIPNILAELPLEELDVYFLEVLIAIGFVKLAQMKATDLEEDEVAKYSDTLAGLQRYFDAFGKLNQAWETPLGQTLEALWKEYKEILPLELVQKDQAPLSRLPASLELLFPAFTLTTNVQAHVHSGDVELARQEITQNPNLLSEMNEQGETILFWLAFCKDKAFREFIFSHPVFQSLGPEKYKQYMNGLTVSQFAVLQADMAADPTHRQTIVEAFIQTLDAWGLDGAEEKDIVTTKNKLFMQLFDVAYRSGDLEAAIGYMQNNIALYEHRPRNEAVNKPLAAYYRLLRKCFEGVGRHGEAKAARSVENALLNISACDEVISHLTGEGKLDWNYVMARLGPIQLEGSRLGSGYDFRNSYKDVIAKVLSKVRVTKECMTYGVLAVNVEKDGACFFRAVAHQLSQLPEESAPESLRTLSHDALRVMTVFHMERHVDYYRSFIESDERSVSAYLRVETGMDKATTWAGEPEIIALTTELGVNLVVLSDQGAPKIYKHDGADKTLCVGYFDNHYVSLIPCEKAATIDLFLKAYQELFQAHPEEHLAPLEDQMTARLISLDTLVSQHALLCTLVDRAAMVSSPVPSASPQTGEKRQWAGLFDQEVPFKRPSTDERNIGEALDEMTEAMGNLRYSA